MASYGNLPQNVTLDIQPFELRVSNVDLKRMYDLLRLSPIGPEVWENSSEQQGQTILTNPQRKYGMRRDWLSNAKQQWLEAFDWQRHEDRINGFPNYTTSLHGTDGIDMTIHFVALFSEKPDAIPIVLYHGWPGAFLEFLGMLDLLRDRYTPLDLPYHIIVPSLPGYGFSNGPPTNGNYTLDQAADLLHHLMVGLGFGSGYLAQGGDVGSFIARYQAARYDACKSAHLNMTVIPPEAFTAEVTDGEKHFVARIQAFFATGAAYAQMQGSRPATIGLALSASPLALLAYLGEKHLEWTDEDPDLDEILATVSLYWLTNTFPRCIYNYRGYFSGEEPPELPFISKPFGFSRFARDPLAAPKSWVEQTGNLRYWYSHEKGGHFAVSCFCIYLLGCLHTDKPYRLGNDRSSCWMM